MAFQGFIKGGRYIPVPTPIFGELLEEIKDINELKIVLRIIRLLHDKKGMERCVTLEELLADRVLAVSLNFSDISERRTQILQALEISHTRNIFIRVDNFYYFVHNMDQKLNLYLSSNDFSQLVDIIHL